MADKDVFVYQIFNNIFSNAIKFSEESGRIEVSIEETDEHVVIGIMDQGGGVPDQLKQSLFDFQNSSPHTGTSGETGTGYGFTLGQNLCGVIWRICVFV